MIDKKPLLEPQAPLTHSLPTRPVRAGWGPRSSSPPSLISASEQAQRGGADKRLDAWFASSRHRCSSTWGAAFEGDCSEAALRKGSSPRRPRPALQIRKRSDVGWGIALRGSLKAAPVRFAKRISFKCMKQCSACRWGPPKRAPSNSGTGIPEGLVPQPAARTG